MRDSGEGFVGERFVINVSAEMTKEFNEKHRSSGNITSDNPLWLSYMSERFDLIQKKIDLAVAKFDILIVDNGKK